MSEPQIAIIKQSELGESWLARDHIPPPPPKAPARGPRRVLTRDDWIEAARLRKRARIDTGTRIAIVTLIGIGRHSKTSQGGKWGHNTCVVEFASGKRARLPLTYLVGLES